MYAACVVLLLAFGLRPSPVTSMQLLEVTEIGRRPKALKGQCTPKISVA